MKLEGVSIAGYSFPRFLHWRASIRVDLHVTGKIKWLETKLR